MPAPSGGPIPSKQVNYLILNDFSCRPDLLRLSVVHRTTPASLFASQHDPRSLPASQPDRQLYASPRLASRRQHRRRALSDSPSFRLYPAENRQPRLPRACGAVSRSRPLDARPPNKGCALPTGAPARAVSANNEKGGGRPTAPPPCSCHPARPTGAVPAPVSRGQGHTEQPADAYCCSGTRISRLPTWFAAETTPSSSICSTRRAALL